MLHDKKSDTDGEKQKVILRRLLEEVSREVPELYYQPTSQIARMIEAKINDGTSLNTDDRALMARLTNRDLEVLLSLH